MRERAEEIGAKLKVWSRDGGGTEVEVLIPGNTAFEVYTSHSKPGWFGKLFRRKAGQEVKKESERNE
jgi:hypothetical protein